MRLFARHMIVALFTLVIGLDAASSESLSTIAVYVWGPINNRVLLIAEIEVDDESGLIQSIRYSDNCASERPNLEAVPDDCHEAGRLYLKQSDETHLTYEMNRRDREGEIRFVTRSESLSVSSDFFQGERRIEFSPEGDAYTVIRAESASYQVRAEQTYLSVNSPRRSTFFLYEAGTKLTSVSSRTPSVRRQATVQTDGEGYYKIEMPPYGDPGEFSHRIEVWTDRPSRGTLRSAAINSYLLPAGTFDFIFPFFAPTPQEILQQASSRE